jgi:hypothetical protein
VDKRDVVRPVAGMELDEWVVVDEVVEARPFDERGDDPNNSSGNLRGRRRLFRSDGGLAASRASQTGHGGS